MVVWMLLYGWFEKYSKFKYKQKISKAQGLLAGGVIPSVEAADSNFRQVQVSWIDFRENSVLPENFGT